MAFNPWVGIQNTEFGIQKMESRSRYSGFWLLNFGFHLFCHLVFVIHAGDFPLMEGVWDC